MIPYINEVNNIFYNEYVYLDIHFTFKKSKNNLLHGEYYYAGITKDLKNYIVNCGRCQASRGLKNVQVPEAPLFQMVLTMNTR